MFRLLFICVVTASALGGCQCKHSHSHGPHHTDPTTVPTPASNPRTASQWGEFEGSWMRTRRGRLVQAYRGVRYAEPPVGELRFQPPRLVERYSSPVDATAEGPACPQPVIDNYPVDEDCLRLNVYTKGNSSSPSPVVVFMHAGGFYSVSGRSDVAGPEYLLDQDLVLVTINYRLGSLGFMSSGDGLVPGNNGFKDQVAALRWVSRNIRAFGGDPNLVTITGYSAGSFSVMLHTVSPMSKGLFHRAISMSGSPISQITLPPHQRHLANKQAELVGCPTTSTKQIVDCLKTKTSKDLGDTLDGFFEFAYDPVLIWMPVVEVDYGQERFLTEQPLDSIREGRMHSVPYIISQTQDEFFWKAFSVLENETLTNKMNSEWSRVAPISFYLPASGAAASRLKQAYLDGKPLRNDSHTADSLGKLYSDAIIGFGVHRLANLMCTYSTSPVYYYEFGYIGAHSHYEDPLTKRPAGAAHHDDLIYLFSIKYLFPVIQVGDTPDSRMVDRITSMWYNFAKHGDPNSPELSVSWPAMKPSQRKYLRVDNQFSIRENLFESRFKVWEELFPLPPRKS